MHFLIIEDHPIIREWLKATLLNSFPGSEVLEASTAKESLSHLPKKRWDVIVLDINLPDRSGIDLLRDFRDLAADSPVLIFSGKPEDEVGRRVFEAGAAGFLPKTSSAAEIKLAIKRVISGKKYVSQDFAASFVSRAVKHGDAPPHEALTPRELEVLRLLGSGCTPTEIAERLAISVKTVSTYRTRVLEKLELRNTAGLIRYALTAHLVD